MKITAARLQRYDLPLHRAWHTAAGGFAQRTGWLLRLDSDNGHSGYGDCAPLPAIGTESLQQADSALADAARRLPGQAVTEALDTLEQNAGQRTPATRCAIESALLDLLARAARQPLCDYLGGRSARRRLAVNAMAGSLLHVSDELIAASCRAGFSIIKLKLGLAPVREEAILLRRIAALLPPGVLLRLDANRAWHEADAARFIDSCAGLPVEMLEEPLAKPEIGSLRRLQADCGFPLGLDESLPDFDLEALLAAPPVRRLVLKPPSLGGLRAALALADRARASGIECVVTSSVESACGVLAAAHLAAALDNGLAHGLATSSWLAVDTGAAPAIEQGFLTLPESGGIGFLPHMQIGVPAAETTRLSRPSVQ